ncbi:MAG: DUF3027 domain-containing protein [Micrococcaceae bacterium]
MPEPAETTDTAVLENPTLGPVRSGRRRPKLDEMLAEAVETARGALLETIDPAEIGEHVSAVADDDRVVTHRFVAHVRGYRGWEWFCTLARAPRSKTLTVCELGMLPGEGALLSPPWVPWSERASEEERVRLRAIAEGQDPEKALAEFRGETDDADADTADSDAGSDSDSEESPSGESADGPGRGKSDQSKNKGKKNKSRDGKGQGKGGRSKKKDSSADAPRSADADLAAEEPDDEAAKAAKKAAKAAKKKAAKKAKKKAEQKAARKAEKAQKSQNADAAEPVGDVAAE